MSLGDALLALLAPATPGIFRVNPADPKGGGTGHTIKVCELLSVPHRSA